MQIGPYPLGDRLPAQRSGTKARAAREFGERARLVADEHVARILTLEASNENQSLWQHGRHVLRRMHRNVDSSIQQGLLDLLGEQAFAALLRQWPILDRVPGCTNDDELDYILIEPGRHRQSGTDHSRLHQGKRTAARSNAQGSGCGLRHITSRC